MTASLTIKDRNGNSVRIGSRIRVLEIPELWDGLEPEERERVSSMRGEVIEVYEVDEYERAWVEKWFDSDSGGPVCHGIALCSNQMELVEP